MSSKPQPPAIPNFGELIEPFLDGKKLVSYESEYFTAPGDNYGSTIFKVVATVQNANGTEKTNLDLIAKLLPENEFFRQMFQPERTFRTEKHCYMKIAPDFIRLQKEAGLSDNEMTNVFAKCYGGRISLKKNADKVDSGAALILDNLATAGYVMGDRLKGFDYETTVVIIRDLARFHATCVAYRTKYPEEFEKYSKSFLKPFAVDHALPEDMRTQMIEDNLNIMKNLPGVNDELFEKIKIAFSLSDEHVNNLEPRPDSLFTAIAHNDFWTNNMMIRYDAQGKPLDMKMVDFQIATYDSLIHDLVFFLALSVQTDIMKTKFDDFVEQYYNQFITWLERLGCDTTNYSFEKFDEELHQIAVLQFQHVVVMHRVLSLRKDKLPEDQLTDVDLLMNTENFAHNYFDKLHDIIKLFEEKHFFRE
ncbi:unnamed protein product [Hermetia illucens]|uniref:CHK kinase-like domain-containing protein n=1 Tax=Hermetia illucens TaxID=343691 RepID=A0A7R8UGM7_HERIL|nr:uncharacterized protein LOC119658287 isoform X2 [Hermetia illucens]CAD7080243.1 unnamed protein product [Hermetia illucens]